MEKITVKVSAKVGEDKKVEEIDVQQFETVQEAEKVLGSDIVLDLVNRQYLTDARNTYRQGMVAGKQLLLAWKQATDKAAFVGGLSKGKLSALTQLVDHDQLKEALNTYVSRVVGA